MAHDAGGGVVGEHALQAFCSLRCAVRHDHLPGMLREAHADPAAVMETYPGRTTRAVEQSIEYRPVRNRVGAVFHPFGFAIGTCHRAGIEVVAANDYRRAEFPFGDHFIESEP